MLIEFKVSNYRSIKDEVVLSLQSTSAQNDLPLSTFQIGKSGINLAKTTAIYGANGSGKSNIWNALLTMWQLVSTSFGDIQGDSLKGRIVPFLLSDLTSDKPSVFEVTFAIDDLIYRYGFTADNKSILEEHLDQVGPSSVKNVFVSTAGELTVGNSFRKSIKNIDVWKASTRKNNALYLSSGATVNVEIPLKVFNWFASLGIVKATSNEPYEQYTQSQFNEIGKEKILKLIKSADISIDDILRNDTTISASQVPEQLRGLFGVKDGVEEINGFNFVSVHKKYNKKGLESGSVNFDFFSAESDGTIKIFNLAGPIIDSLENGKILFVDEFESRLHPLLLESLVKLFNGPLNTKNAQLIFCVHNTILLQNKTVRRDQIWFTDKDKFGATRLYSLADFKPRKDDSLEKKYLNGIFGAIPYIEDLEL